MPPPKNQASAFRGASLYSGIFDQQESSQPQPSSASNPSPTQTTSTTPPAEANSSTKPCDANKSTAWSAALRFAPRKTAAAKAKAKPNAAFVASFTSAPPSTSVETAPKGALSRAPGVPPSQPSRFDSAKAEPKAEARKEIDTSDLNLTALALPSISTDDEWLISELQKHPVFEAPPFSLPAEQVEREKVLIRQANAGAGRGWNEEEERGEDGVEGGEEDVNGFLGTSAGRRAMKRKQRKRKRSPTAGVNMNADYDPKVPNDYMVYKRMVYQRRRAQLEWEKRIEEEGWDEEDEDEEEERGYDRFPPPPPPLLEPQKRDSKNLTGQEAYARRVAMSCTPTQALTGEEAYQRRLAMSQSQPQIPTTPRVAPPPPGPPPLPPPTAEANNTAAATIADRLSQPRFISSTISRPEDASGESDNRSFAERYMSASGYIPGQGIGAAHNKGITVPLTVSQCSSKRGQIHDPCLTQHQQAELAKFGSPSRIIVLLNMITTADLQRSKEDKEELIEDVSTECGKYGIVKNLVPITNKRTQERQGEVRVFVEFSGQAGSWKAIRALNRRWFEGRQVKAFYYPEEAFHRREYALELPHAHT